MWTISRFSELREVWVQPLFSDKHSLLPVSGSFPGLLGDSSGLSSDLHPQPCCDSGREVWGVQWGSPPSWLGTTWSLQGPFPVSHGALRVHQPCELQGMGSCSLQHAFLVTAMGGAGSVRGAHSRVWDTCSL